MQGVGTLLQIIDKVKARLNKNLGLAGVLLTHYDGRKVLARNLWQSGQAYFPGKVFETKIRSNVALLQKHPHRAWPSFVMHQRVLAHRITQPYARSFWQQSA